MSLQINAQLRADHNLAFESRHSRVGYKQEGLANKQVHQEHPMWAVLEGLLLAFTALMALLAASAAAAVVAGTLDMEVAVAAAASLVETAGGQKIFVLEPAGPLLLQHPRWWWQITAP
jgi:hypothetical protein